VTLDEFGNAVDALVGCDPTDFADGESLVALHRRLAQLEAFVASTAACFEASGAYATEGSRTASAWLSVNCHLPATTAARELRLGRAMRQLPHASAAWLGGEISSAHVAAMASLAGGRSAEALGKNEEMLVGQAKVLRFEDFQKSLSYFAQLADPDGTDEHEQDKRTRRDVSLVPSIGGMFFGRITLDPISGAIVAGELERIERELYDHDRRQAAARLGREPTIRELVRTPSQRRADALVEMATRSGATPPDAARPVPLFSVFVGYETLFGRICELASGQVVSPGSLVPWLDQAFVERAVFDPSGRVEIGALRRLFDGATRRAVELRDRRCVHPYCDRPGARCQVDHIVPFSAGGPTVQENGQMLCPFHNRLAYRNWLALDEATKQAMIARLEHLRQQPPQAGEGDEQEQRPDRAPPAEE
jgi:hypothetical protein